MSVIDQIFEKAKSNPQKVVFPEALNEKMMKAAFEVKGIFIRFLLEIKQKLNKLFKSVGMIFLYLQLWIWKMKSIEKG